MHRCRFASCGHFQFYSLTNLQQHERNAHAGQRGYPCIYCANIYSRDLHRHLHQNNCPQNPSIQGRSNSSINNQTIQHAGASGSGLRTGLRNINTASRLLPRVYRTAFGGANKSWRVSFHRNRGSEHAALIAEACQTLIGPLSKYRNQYLSLKLTSSLHLSFHKASDSSISCQRNSNLVSIVLQQPDLGGS